MGVSLFRRVLEKEVFRSSVRIGQRMMSSRSDKYQTFLMVPPFFDDSGNVLNNFHRIGSEEKISRPKTRSGGGGGEVVGMSKGWLALYNRDSHGACILNPITGRRIELPPLPDPHRPNRMVLDRSPDDSDDARAVTICGGGKGLAFCVPGRSTEWTPCIDDSFTKINNSKEMEYEDVTHSRDEKIFYSVTKNPTAVEAWDVRGPESPRIATRYVGADRVNVDGIDRSYWLDLDRNDFPWPCRSEEDWEVKKKKKLSWRIKYVVQGHYEGEIYVVVRHVIPDRPYKYKTFDFDVYSIGFGVEARYMKANLGGMSIFVGNSESSGVEAYLHPDFKPDCIYFTDDNRLMHRRRSSHDNGIFDYRNNAFATCTPCTHTDHQPLWFHHF